MFDPDGDAAKFQEVLIHDNQIATLMGLQSATLVEKAKSILKRNKWDDMPGNEKRICLYFRPSFNPRNEIISREMLKVDVHVPMAEDYLGLAIQKRVHHLFHKFRFDGRIIHSIGQIGEAQTMPGYYCVASLFKYYITK